MTIENSTLSATYSGVTRALRWIEEELFICTEDEVYNEFERKMNCKFSGDRTTLTFPDDKARWWFKARWK
jgi:hypothetical protein